MTIQDQYATSSRLAQDSMTQIAQTWTEGFARGLQRFSVPVFPVIPFDASAAVSQWFDAAQHVLEANRAYVKTLAGVATNLDDAVREQTVSSIEAARSQVAGVLQTAESQVEELGRTAREQAEVVHDVQEKGRREAEAAERAAAREAEAAERAAAREARSQARQRYESLRKAELVEELDRRNLVKTGTVDELVERLVENDTK